MQLTINISNQQLFDKILWLLKSFKEFDGLEYQKKMRELKFDSDNITKNKHFYSKKIR